MSRMDVVASIVRITCLTAMVACLVGVGGCGRSNKVEARTTTVGQELQDLDDARGRGLLTEEEYNKQRREIMKHK